MIHDEQKDLVLGDVQGFISVTISNHLPSDRAARA